MPAGLDRLESGTRSAPKWVPNKVFITDVIFPLGDDWAVVPLVGVHLSWLLGQVSPWIFIF